MGRRRGRAGAPVRAEPEPRPEPQGPLPESPYRPRFGFLTGALIGIAIAVIGLGVVLALDSSSEPSVPDGWSAWTPTAEDDVGIAKQIAEHVGPKYRLGNGSQLVGVEASGLEVSDPPVPFDVAVRTAPVGGDIELLEGNGVMYVLLGFGPGGSIPGTPTEERGLLVRREALELALYTFRYADDVDTVVTLLPPRAAEAEEGADAQPPAPGRCSTGPATSPTGSTSRSWRRSRRRRRGPRRSSSARPRRAASAPSAGPTSSSAAFRQGQNAHAYLVLDRPQR